MYDFISRSDLLRTLNKKTIPFNADINYVIETAPAADVMPKTKEAAIDYLREIGWLEAHDLSIMGHVE
jgi:hypothetical protein